IEINNNKLVPYDKLEMDLPSKFFLYYPLETYTAPLQHPIHMPQQYAMSYSLFNYIFQIDVRKKHAVKR
ncbi:MAG TPA: hypothetical protein VHJ38_09530, partial [Nitrososphaeraceae archaeon]|nr:hypothetical protein [Nitrososphaeraceae archaeon]